MIKRKEMCSDLIMNICSPNGALMFTDPLFQLPRCFSHITQMNDKKIEKQNVLNVLLHCAQLQQW